MQDGMTHSESGKKGYAKSIDTIRAGWERKRVEYEANPKRCPNCDKVIPYEKRRHDFCNRSCAASHNNKGTRRHGSKPENCGECGTQLDSGYAKFCSRKCFQDNRYRTWIEKWLSGKISGKGKGWDIPQQIRRWVREQQGHKCLICGITEWTGQPVPLVLDHIDGNALNNRPENFRLICWNCDALLPTHGNRNKGRGRNSLVRGSRTY